MPTELKLALILVVAAIVVAGFVALMSFLLLPEFREKIWAMRAARHLGLRDRGRVGQIKERESTKTWVHAFCETPVRIGITNEAQPVRYCWRCEKIFDGVPSGPKGRKGIPTEHAPTASAGEKIVALSDFRKAS